MKTAEEKPQKRQKLEPQTKKAKKEKAQQLPALTHNFTHNKILDAQKRLLKGLKKREEKAKARVKLLGALNKKRKAGDVEGT